MCLHLLHLQLKLEEVFPDLDKYVILTLVSVFQEEWGYDK